MIVLNNDTICQAKSDPKHRKLTNLSVLYVVVYGHQLQASDIRYLASILKPLATGIDEYQGTIIESSRHVKVQMIHQVIGASSKPQSETFSVFIRVITRSTDAGVRRT